jgi:hypothetical protein
MFRMRISAVANFANGPLSFILCKSGWHKTMLLRGRKNSEQFPNLLVPRTKLSPFFKTSRGSHRNWTARNLQLRTLSVRILRKSGLICLDLRSSRTSAEGYTVSINSVMTRREFARRCSEKTWYYSYSYNEYFGYLGDEWFGYVYLGTIQSTTGRTPQAQKSFTFTPAVWKPGRSTANRMIPFSGPF